MTTNPSPSTTRPIFEPVDTSFNPSEHSARDRDDVESPSLTSGNALARFEFEPGRSKDGTKVLMVEWEEDESSKRVAGDWEISWEGKRTVLPARDPVQEEGEEAPVNRLYFLLGPGVSVPGAVKLQKGNASSAVTWRTNPLPAIFPPELGATARAAGKKGVLHTIWAKKRLQVLTKEIEQEEKDNVEGIGLEMAVAEKEWIEQNFGVVAKPGSISLATAPSAMASVMGQGSLNSPTSPRSPGGGRLMDKLKGLKIGTSEQDLSGRKENEQQQQQPHGYHNPLSPETSDVAVGSFGSFAALKGAPPPSAMAAKPPQPPQPQPQPQPQRKIAAQRPPESFASQQRQAGGMGSLNAFASGDVGASNAAQEDTGDDLFALPMSPRSPEMTKSPFSFAAQDTVKYLDGEKAS
ncbi:hypothetical protein M409DRAFT_20917 [Zasmidium cellare ATCC 36951]|uniref:Uncharacterized protein n=1 Tax=Zasmidium cellare ATCC 36951 TaxID=1080233 RepID=A0A6A6CQE6_ZASCE|nr:uncharacterized protein M409DRAFT_20917 [Zasmidium cellare ATCC 36951]KAF2168903.1 hypothetical protein M409DRAFT_20917 [Zasmidium cellare ATCC 36951]